MGFHMFECAHNAIFAPGTILHARDGPLTSKGGDKDPLSGLSHCTITLGQDRRNFLAVNSNSNIEFDGMKKLENHVFKCIFCNCATICFIYVMCSKIVKILHLMFFKCALDVVLNFRAETSEHSQFSLIIYYPLDISGCKEPNLQVLLLVHCMG